MIATATTSDRDYDRSSARSASQRTGSRSPRSRTIPESLADFLWTRIASLRCLKMVHAAGRAARLSPRTSGLSCWKLRVSATPSAYRPTKSFRNASVTC